MGCPATIGWAVAKAVWCPADREFGHDRCVLRQGLEAISLQHQSSGFATDTSLDRNQFDGFDGAIHGADQLESDGSIQVDCILIVGGDFQIDAF